MLMLIFYKEPLNKYISLKKNQCCFISLAMLLLELMDIENQNCNRDIELKNDKQLLHIKFM